MLEVTIIRYLLLRENFDKYHAFIVKLALEPELMRILKLLPRFFDESIADNCTMQELRALFELEYPDIKDAQMYSDLFTQIEESDIGDAVLVRLVEKLIYKDVNNQVIQACMPVLSNTDDGDSLEKVRVLLDEYDKMLTPDAAEDIFVTDDLDILLASEIRGSGLKWRLRGLNEAIGDLRGGSLGHIFARPDVGKTTMLISEMSFWADQLEQNEMGIWVNNEERGFKLRLKWWSAITGWSAMQLNAQAERAKAYYNSLPGSKVKLYDRGGVTDRQILYLLKTFHPRFLIIDQGDKVKSSMIQNQNDAARLGELYAMYREWAKEYETDILTVGQAHADAEGKKFLHKGWMNKSKTDKPGELDYAIGIGIDGIGNESMTRYISICKNKNGPHTKFSVAMNPQQARFGD